MPGIHDQKVYGPDVATGDDRWPQGEDRPTNDMPLRLGDDDTGLREIDELAQEIRSIKRAFATVHSARFVAQGDDAVDIRDTGCSDLVFHADWSYLARLATRTPRSEFDRGAAVARGPLVGGERWTLATR